jgi:hypothetical protein
MSQETNQSENQTTPHEEILSPAPCEGDKTLRAAVGTSAGASPCNTAPPIYQQQDILPLKKSIDSLYLTYQGIIHRDIEHEFESLKLIASNRTPSDTSEAVFKVLEHCFEVKPAGTRKFAYVLEDNWFYIKVSSSKAIRLPLASVQISSELLTFHPLDEIIERVNGIVSSIGSIHGGIQGC